MNYLQRLIDGDVAITAKLTKKFSYEGFNVSQFVNVTQMGLNFNFKS